MTPRRNRRRLWLSLTLAAAALFLVSAPVGSWLEYRSLRHNPGEVVAYIGLSPNIPAGQRASLLRLTQEIARHPDAAHFAIRHTDTPFAWDEIDWWETIYDRRGQRILDGNIGFGDTEDWGGVTDQLVKSVAASQAGFPGFARRGCRNLLP